MTSASDYPLPRSLPRGFERRVLDGLATADDLADLESRIAEYEAWICGPHSKAYEHGGRSQSCGKLRSMKYWAAKLRQQLTEEAGDQ